MIEEIFDKINKCIDENKYTYYYTEEDKNGKCACSDETITSDGLSELLGLLENDLYVLAIANEQSVQESTEIIAELKAENERLKKEIKINLQRANALNRELNQLQSCLQEIKEIAENCVKDCIDCSLVAEPYECEDCTNGGMAKLGKQILQKIAECEVNE